MKRRTHSAKVPVEIVVNGEGLDLVAEVRFTYTPGSPMRWPSFSDPGSPADPAEVADIEVLAVRNEDTGELLTPPRWLRDFIENNADIDVLADAADEDLEYEREVALERRYEQQRDDRDYERRYGSHYYAED